MENLQWEFDKKMFLGKVICRILSRLQLLVKYSFRRKTEDYSVQ